MIDIHSWCFEFRNLENICAASAMWVRSNDYIQLSLKPSPLPHMPRGVLLHSPVVKSGVGAEGGRSTKICATQEKELTQQLMRMRKRSREPCSETWKLSLSWY